jgi:hypothetical protein
MKGEIKKILYLKLAKIDKIDIPFPQQAAQRYKASFQGENGDSKCC